MLHRISILAFLGLAAALVAAPANADGVPVHLTGDLERDADAAPHYWHHVHIGENSKLDANRFSTFKGDVFEDADFDSDHSKHGFSGAPNTAEWIWWLNHSDKDKKEFGKNPVGDAPIATPEPASLFLLGSGVLALGVWRRRANHSASIS